MATRGIDISSHQGDINLEALKNDIDFVIIRVGYGTKGTIDPKFQRNVNECIRLGIPFGFYWYSYALNIDGAKQEAMAFLSAIKPYTPTYGCWYDMEDADHYKAKNGMPSHQTLQDMCYTFCETVENAGYYTGIYASQCWFNNHLASEKLERFDKWVALWPTSRGKQKGLSIKADSKKDLSMWQFTSMARFPGYNGYLDTNYAYKTFPNPGIVNPPVPPVPPTPVQKFNIGDRVLINGALFANSNASTSAGNITNKITNITRYASGAAHPYNTTGDLGWMNESDIQIYVDTIHKGSKIKFLGTKSYSGIELASWVTGSIFDVIEVSGDRVVIGKGTSVTAAVNMRDCQLV